MKRKFDTVLGWHNIIFDIPGVGCLEFCPGDKKCSFLSTKQERFCARAAQMYIEYNINVTYSVLPVDPQ